MVDEAIESNIITKWLFHGLKFILEVILVIIIAFGGILALREFVVDWYVVPTESMENTIQIGDKLVGDKWWWKIDGLHRGDVMTFDEDGTILVKRVIGLPGERLDITDGSVYINGILLDEDYVVGETFAQTNDFRIILGDDEYFMMGDNREHSKDSRMLGPMKLDDMESRVLWVF